MNLSYIRRGWLLWALVGVCLLVVSHCTPTSTGVEPPQESPVTTESLADAASLEGRQESGQESPAQEFAPEQKTELSPEPGPVPGPDASEPVIPESQAEAIVQEARPEPVGDGQFFCQQDADCPASTCQEASPCTQRTYLCQSGLCVLQETTHQDATCDVRQGVCVARTCLSHCDCPQGYDCLSGLCQIGIKAKYCCENALCPQSQPCTSRLQIGSFCTPGGTGEKVCKDYTGYCADKAFTCQKGYLSYPQVPCDNKQQHCCLLPPTNTQCKGKGGRCVPVGSACLPHEQVGGQACATSQDQCCMPIAPPPTDCAIQGGVCYNLNQACKAGYTENITISCRDSQLKCCVPQGGPKCQQDTDCGASTCQETAKGCAETIPRCVGGQCLRNPSTAPGKCDNTKGRCL